MKTKSDRHDRMASSPTLWAGLAVFWACLSPAARAESPPECKLVRLVTVNTDVLQDGLVKIPVTVEGRPLNFLLDTGGVRTTIKWEQAKGLGLVPKQTSEQIVGVAGSMLNFYVSSGNFSVGELHIKDLPIYIESRPLAGADGTLGPDVMQDYDVDIDFAHGQLSLISQDHCPGQVVDWTTTGFIVIPMDVERSGHVRFPVKINDQDVMAILDTGSNVSLISMTAAIRLGIDPKAPELKLVRDNGEYQLFTYPFQSLNFGRVSVKNPPIVIASDNFAKKLGTDLVLGTQVLSHLHIYIAYGEKRLYITSAQAN